MAASRHVEESSSRKSWRRRARSPSMPHFRRVRACEGATLAPFLARVVVRSAPTAMPAAAPLRAGFFSACCPAELGFSAVSSRLAASSVYRAAGIWKRLLPLHLRWQASFMRHARCYARTDARRPSPPSPRAAAAAGRFLSSFAEQLRWVLRAGACMHAPSAMCDLVRELVRMISRG